MAYVLKQYSQFPESEKDASQIDYMTLLTNGKATRFKSAVDMEISGESGFVFYDEGLLMETAFSKDISYYLHSKIKREDTTLTFNVYLINSEREMDDSIAEPSKNRQFLKTIQVKEGLTTEWVDFEIVFTPLAAGFDGIMFKLIRVREDYSEEPRYPVFCYEEVSLVNRAIQSSNEKWIKLGIQARPGFMMCINGEEIRVGRTGTYELRNGIITIDFFGVVKAAVEDINGLNALVINGKKVSFKEYLDYIADITNSNKITSSNETHSRSILGNSKLRATEAYTVDYMYKEAIILTREVKGE